MSLTDWCPMCQRPEVEHTAEELRVCWEAIALDAELSRPQEEDDVDG